MEEKKLVKLLKRGDEKALELIIEKYTGYVSTVIANQLGGFSDMPAIEELTSDVFFELWRRRLELVTFHLRGWLGTTARNKAKNYARLQNIVCENFDEDCIDFSDDSLFDKLEQAEKRNVLISALALMKAEEREVIVRYYYYNQSTAVISKEIKAKKETVKSRLKRSREKLKSILSKGGYFQ